jgi:hypothetical protein
VSGQLKTCQELTTMSRRGFTACESCGSYTGTACRANDHKPVPSSQDLEMPKTAASHRIRIRQALTRFEGMGLFWHPEQTRLLL